MGVIGRSGLFHVNNLNIVREPLIHSFSFHTIAIHDYRKEVNQKQLVYYSPLFKFYLNKNLNISHGDSLPLP